MIYSIDQNIVNQINKQLTYKNISIKSFNNIITLKNSSILMLCFVHCYRISNRIHFDMIEIKKIKSEAANVTKQSFYCLDLQTNSKSVEILNEAISDQILTLNCHQNQNQDGRAIIQFFFTKLFGSKKHYLLIQYDQNLNKFVVINFFSQKFGLKDDSIQKLKYMKFQGFALISITNKNNILYLQTNQKNKREDCIEIDINQNEKIVDCTFIPKNDEYSPTLVLFLTQTGNIYSAQTINIFKSKLPVEKLLKIKSENEVICQRYYQSFKLISTKFQQSNVDILLLIGNLKTKKSNSISFLEIFVIQKSKNVLKKIIEVADENDLQIKQIWIQTARIYRNRLYYFHGNKFCSINLVNYIKYFSNKQKYEMSIINQNVTAQVLLNIQKISVSIYFQEQYMFLLGFSTKKIQKAVLNLDILELNFDFKDINYSLKNHMMNNRTQQKSEQISHIDDGQLISLPWNQLKPKINKINQLFQKIQKNNSKIQNIKQLKQKKKDISRQIKQQTQQFQLKFEELNQVINFCKQNRNAIQQEKNKQILEMIRKNQINLENLLKKIQRKKENN